VETKSQIRTKVHEWYAQHSAPMLLFGIALTGDKSRAQDAVHNVFLKLLTFSDLSRIETVPTYLFSALRNTIASDARRQARETTLEPWFEPTTHNPAEELHLRQALSTLPQDQREVTVLHIWAGLTFAETAEVLGINSNTAAARYRYAITKLRDQLSPKKEAPID
jgi:RNA polymerase sigma-70 factor, ECF subfamily